MSYEKELNLMIESISSGRMMLEHIKSKNIYPNKVKYTIVLIDTAIPSNLTKRIRNKPKKDDNNIKENIKETRKKPVVVQSGPVAPEKPPMAEITPIGH